VHDSRVGNYTSLTVSRNEEAALKKCTCNNLKIMNTFFKHKETLKVTSKARGHKSISDYFITNM
jgi:hypothetical protein